MLRKPLGKRVRLTLVGAVALLTAGCGMLGKPVTPPPPPPTEITVGIPSEPQTLNPIFAEDRSSLAVIHALFDSVEAEGPDGVPRPELADRVTVSPDGTTYTIHLRPGATWHDGEPVTAADVLFTYRAILQSQVQSPYRPLFLVDGEPPEMRQLDEQTLEIRLPHPSAGFVNALTVGILPEHAFPNGNVKDSRFSDHPIGSGPFSFVQWNRGQNIQLKRFDGYFAGRPGVDQLTYRIVPESNQRSAFASKSIDVFVPTPADVLKIQQDASADKPDLVHYSSESVMTLLVHQRGSYLADHAVRKALALSIDRSAIADKAFGGPGLASPADSLFPPGNWAHDNRTPPAPNPAAAKKILDEAGYVTNSSGWRVKDGKVLSFQLLYISDRTTDKIAQMLADQAAEVGIQIQPKGVDRTAFYQTLDAPEKNFDLALNTYWLGPDPDAFADLLTTHGEYNFQEYDNPQVDKWFTQARETSDQGARLSLYRQIDQSIRDDVPVIPLVYPEGFLAVRRTIVNVEKADPAPVVLFRYLEQLGVNPGRAVTP
ncbi:ABC transporter substrate-binding protein [Kyrpidia sp.]|uniref:ABC transporter substrate-binding protein n=1 Tax=Kyrpidia sp. TaxID=2073077 RepID=UPI00258FB86F|nr:ABC transporter substrate-binding protein [Kyrpidia sp.]MCL6575986.1 ABC transporter substrate-binding protein [Kyrpidia sp.]